MTDDRIYPIELIITPIKYTSNTASSALYIDLNIEIYSEGQLKTNL